MIAKSKRSEVVDRENSRPNEATDGGGFERSVVGTARNVSKSSDELGRAVKRSVLEEQVRKEVEATSFEVGGGMNGRGRRHKKFDGVRRATENKASKSRRRG